MSRKKKRNRTRKQKAVSRAGGSEYWLGRAARFAASGRDAKLDEALDRALGDDAGARLIWLLAHRPTRARLSSPPSDAELTALREAILTLDVSALSDLGLPDDWLAQAHALHAANAALADGRDALAMTHLRSLGRRSHFADAVRFLRGLAAWYAADDVGARRLLEPLSQSAAYGGAIGALLADGERPLSPAAKRARPFLGMPATVLDPLLDAFDQGQPKRLVDAWAQLHARHPSLRGQLRVLAPFSAVAIGASPATFKGRVDGIEPFAMLRAGLAMSAMDEMVIAGRNDIWLKPLRALWPTMDTERALATVLEFSVRPLIDDGRVGTPDRSGAPLTEPDLWASHPALQRCISTR